MKDSEVGRRLREQIGTFSGIFLPRFSKPQGHFVEQMLFGMQAAQDVKLSNIGRALGENIALKKTEERLSHHLAAPGMGQVINEVVVAQAADSVKEDTLIVIDPTDIRKTYARRMPYLATVRDGSTGEIGAGVLELYGGGLQTGRAPGNAAASAALVSGGAGFCEREPPDPGGDRHRAFGDGRAWGLCG